MDPQEITEELEPPPDSTQLLMRGVATVDIVDGARDGHIAASTKMLDAEHLSQFERSVRSIYDQMGDQSPAAIGPVLRLLRRPDAAISSDARERFLGRNTSRAADAA